MNGNSHFVIPVHAVTQWIQFSDVYILIETFNEI